MNGTLLQPGRAGCLSRRRRRAAIAAAQHKHWRRHLRGWRAGWVRAWLHIPSAGLRICDGRRYICLAVRSRVTRATGEHAARRGASRATGEHAAPSGCDDACGRGWSGSTRFAARLPVTQSRSTHVEVCSRCAPSFLLHSFSSPALPDCSTSRSGSCSFWIMSVNTKMLRSDLKLLNERKK